MFGAVWRGGVGEGATFPESQTMATVVRTRWRGAVACVWGDGAVPWDAVGRRGVRDAIRDAMAYAKATARCRGGCRGVPPVPVRLS